MGGLAPLNGGVLSGLNMELGLNLFWLLLTVVSFALWGRRRSSDAGGRQRLPLLSAIALGSALAILFPVISVTDDLHAEQAVLEDSNPSKRALRQAHDSLSNSGKLRHAVAAAPAAVLAPLALVTLGIASEAPTRSPAPLAADSHPGRAPPRSTV